MSVIIIKIAELKYTGDSIGDDIRLEVEFLGKSFSFDKKIKPMGIFKINKEIGRIETDNQVFEKPIKIKVIEQDLVFDDIGKAESVVKVDTAVGSPQKCSFTVKVQEFNKTLRKSSAIFEVVLEVEIVEPKKIIKLQQYRPSLFGEDYNKYDAEIIEAVNYWNEFFAQQKEAPLELLDPNLVKAMAYVESKVGNFRPKNKKFYPGFPDIMQVADPRNGAIYALQNSINPESGKKSTEYEVHDGKLVRLQYPEANGSEMEESLKWGVRWLYRVAQANIEENGVWRRQWRSWKDAVMKYNNGGDKNYVPKVYAAYENGIGEQNFKLWMIPILILLGLGIGGYQLSATEDVDSLPVDTVIDETRFPDRTNFIPATRFDSYEGSTTTLGWDMYPPTGCKSDQDDMKTEENLKNCNYTVGTNWSPQWTVKLTDGLYYFIKKDLAMELDNEVDGPAHVTFEQSAIGDLNHDGLDDAVVVLNVNYGGTANVLNMVVLVQDGMGQYTQMADYMFLDRDVIQYLFIDHGVITARVFVHAEDDPLCCATHYDTYRFKIVDWSVLRPNDDLRN
ncbi:MAG: Uncharacterized protein G01um101418_790 [Parcubacteria group bacterium Gr01-1014_18]|nr:MAG: Uncharacterized protein Greene041636_672 [Parcubacteria group bacterium Greene0416_36]TSC80092.1 MAG: Uncharacterized protein G01um101418_790 [Parcubacteria group bacterium Gr01-1014_18]TSC98618.1 MAG: Uncharacterized protein Greene101420_670 [Parcubacteria group bacterium Greene1014_20]TSD06445.1 MAG: Uncharacterized protein Greene07142_936 [Parcubacteria group bacterium Greene0714_2]